MKLSFLKRIIAGSAIGFLVLFPIMPQVSITNISPSSPSPSFSSAAQAISPSHQIAFSIRENIAYATSTSGAVSLQSPGQSVNLFSCSIASGDIATCLIQGVGLVVMGAINLFVNLGALLVQQGLIFNENVFSSPMVQVGFSVALAMANLGFVLGIIIIALATILRSQNYGIKQVLWRLVVMAILVNFGLVISAPIVGFADSITNYFVLAASGNTTDGYSTFTSNLVGALGPQAFLEPQTQTQTTAGKVSNGVYNACEEALNGGVAFHPFSYFTSGWCKGFATKASGQTPSDADRFWTTMMAIIFDIIFTLLIAITLLTLAVLLLIRYVMLAVLMILLPLAWLAWVFPQFKSHFHDWWNNFIKWAFFPPLALFFIYLGLQTVSNTNYIQSISMPGNSTQNAEGGVQVQIKEVGPIAQGIGDMLLIAIIVSGLLASSKLTGKFGGVVVEGSKSAVKAMGGYVGKQGKKGARAGFHAMGGHDAVKAMREGRMLGLQRIPGMARIGSLAGRAAQSHLTNSEMVENSKKKVPKSIEEIKQNLRGSMNTEDRLAHIAALAEKGELSMDDKVGNQTVAEFLDSHPEMATRYGFGKSAKDADKSMASDAKMRNSMRSIQTLNKQKAELIKNGGDASEIDTKITEETANLDKNTNEFFSKLEKGDIKKMNLNEILGKDDIHSQAIAKNFALYNHSFISTALSKLKSKQLARFNEVFQHELEEEKSKRSYFKEDEVKEAEIGDAQKQKEAIQQQHRNEIIAQESIIDDLKKEKFTLDTINPKTLTNAQKERLRVVQVQIDSEAHNLETLKKQQARQIEEVEGRINTKKKEREALQKDMTSEEINLSKAESAFEKSIAHNTFGEDHEDHGDHGGGGEKSKSENKGHH